MLLTPEGTIAGARVRTFLLEKRRVAAPPPPRERNFHVFYMLAARAAGSLLPAGRTAQSFRCLACADADADADAAGHAVQLDELVAALRQLFVPEEAQAAVWRLLGAILLLGEVTFDQEEGQGGAARPARPEVLRAAEEAFGCPGLGALLTAQEMPSPRGSSTYSIALFDTFRS